MDPDPKNHDHLYRLWISILFGDPNVPGGFRLLDVGEQNSSSLTIHLF